MLRKLQDKSPILTWAIVGALIFAGGWLVLRQATLRTSQEMLGSDVAIRFEDTGEEIRMQRGRFERLMLEEGVNGPLDPAKGVMNPKTNQPTGFPVDREYWNQLVAAVNEAMKSTSPAQPGQTPKP